MKKGMEKEGGIKRKQERDVEVQRNIIKEDQDAGSDGARSEDVN